MRFKRVVRTDHSLSPTQRDQPLDTHALIERLAGDLKPVDRRQVEKLVCMALASALLVALAIVAALLHFRPDLNAAISTPIFWGKLLYGLSIAVVAGMMTCRLARPAVGAAELWPLLALIFAAIAIWGGHDLSTTSGMVRARLWLGQTWSQCPLLIVGIALPGLAGLMEILRRLAPTRLRLAGMATGLTAGGAAACIYALHCKEDSIPFLATWYTLGILATAGLGALLGPRWLRW